MYSALSTLNTTTEVPLSKAPNPQLLPGRRSINGCPLLRVCVHSVCVFTAVCVHFGWVECRPQIPSMGHLAVCHVTFTFTYEFVIVTEAPQCNRMTATGQDTDNKRIIYNIQIGNVQNSKNTIYNIDNYVYTGLICAN